MASPAPPRPTRREPDRRRCRRRPTTPQPQLSRQSTSGAQQPKRGNSTKRSFSVFSMVLAVLFLPTGSMRVDARDNTQSPGGPSHNMRLVGTNDLQARSTYQPTLHKYSSHRYILFTDHHALARQGEGLLP